MKYLIHLVVTIFVGWPALFAGYLWAAVVSGWRDGKFTHDRHEDAAIKKWLGKKP
jgi:hypothetical protein